jgi:hypothetical protein
MIPPLSYIAINLRSRAQIVVRASVPLGHGRMISNAFGTHKTSGAVVARCAGARQSSPA